ncbi:MAG: YifB family Mg chelatase-like AAA ATPase [Christensenellales bacterium]
MLITMRGMGLEGIEGFPVSVEAHIDDSSAPFFEIVGLPGMAVRESKERVRSAIRNSGFGMVSGRIVVNLAPADRRKEGPAFDLPIAVAMVAASGMIKLESASDAVLIGELSLDGSVRSVRGILPLAISAREAGVKRAFIPCENAHEVFCVSGIEIFPVKSLKQTISCLMGREKIAPVAVQEYSAMLGSREPSMDFSNVKGQHSAKRALEIAAAGGHNVLMMGAPGSGKTLMARCVPGILPGMEFDEALEVTRIHSAAGIAPETGLLLERPFRSPHHTASPISIIGGGLQALPGEISKAHHGVLFLDELPEFRRDLLEVLRQPMEDGFVNVTRVGAQATYPAQFMLICSMNPCPCGNFGSRTKPCRCSPMQIQRYLSRVSGPMLDRIDMHIEVESIPADRITSNEKEESSFDIRKRVEAARAVQRERFRGAGISCNARLDAKTLPLFCPMTDGAMKLLRTAVDSMGLSNRAYTRVLKVARTIADLARRDEICEQDVAESVQYRSLDRKYWG